jgi:hypothetical protein
MKPTASDPTFKRTVAQLGSNSLIVDACLDGDPNGFTNSSHRFAL